MTHKTTLRFSDDQWEQIERAADKTGQNLTDFFRNEVGAAVANVLGEPWADDPHHGGYRPGGFGHPPEVFEKRKTVDGVDPDLYDILRPYD